MENGCIAIKLNDDIGHFFQTKKGVRQGDPLSSMRFNLDVDVLPLLIDCAKSDGQLKGVVPHLVEDGLADDTILY